MGIFKSLKGSHPDTLGGSGSQSNDETNRSQPQSSQIYTPPSGPPLHQQRSQDNPFVSLPSQPLSPPPHQVPDVEPPPYHDWTVIEDTALLPPPPSLRYDASPSGNASPSDADRAHEWCRARPLIKPHQPLQAQHDTVKFGNLRLIRPLEFQGDLSMQSPGFWRGSTNQRSRDSCLLSSLPLYFAIADSPFNTVRKKVIYFEVKILWVGGNNGADESSLALGYCALPYPTWRMPGWERGSLAVHADDGRRYVNNTWGGKDFTSSVQEGETIGLGMTFDIPDSPPEYREVPAEEVKLKVDVFFTRNGKPSGGWNLHEELDAQDDLGVDGLDGLFDLYGAVGTFGDVKFEAAFSSRDWLWQPVNPES
ncbi:MAG: hypothetical protein LQ342_000487 [Letrouitia transgressa]|nr:MAG: hypothetical protein LQ342_000487 [Letrouitia transgressa]